jgi:hypothetical protein
LAGVEGVDGLPVTTGGTLADSLSVEGEISIAADALRDALRGDLDLDPTRARKLLAPRASRTAR